MHRTIASGGRISAHATSMFVDHRRNRRQTRISAHATSLPVDNRRNRRQARISAHAGVGADGDRVETRSQPGFLRILREPQGCRE
jgi:hypothetical protein